MTETRYTNNSADFEDVADHDHDDIKQLAKLMDNQFRIPGTGVTFGFDAMLGLIPVAGDLAGGAISVYLIGKAIKQGAPATLVVRMATNAGIDLAAGSVPLVGDLFDIAWQANHMNVKLLDAYLREQARK